MADTDEQLEKLELLHQSLLDSVGSYESAQALLHINEQLINEPPSASESTSESASESTSQLQAVKKHFILDSFRVNKVIKDYKDWNHQTTQDFINHEIFNYNKVLTDNNRIQRDVDKLTSVYEELYNKVSLPDVDFSIQTLLHLGDEGLLANLPRDENNEYPRIININQLYSLDPKSKLAFPDYVVFQKMIDIEYRLRASRRLKYEILLLIKNQVAVNNNKWNKRDSELKSFLNTRLPKVFDEVATIKRSEAKALKVRGGDEEIKTGSENEEDEEDDDEEIIQQDFDEDEDEDIEDDEVRMHANGTKNGGEEDEEEEDDDDEDEDSYEHEAATQSRQLTAEFEDDPEAITNAPSTKQSDLDSDGDELLI